MFNRKHKIFDPIRKKYVALTPEERVRQQFIGFLLHDKGFPAGLMQVEYALKVNGMSRRCDIVACTRSGVPLLLVECKAPDVPIGDETFAQAARYNIALRVPYLAITNGSSSYCCHICFETGSIKFLNDFPAYAAIIE
ncbi:MAG: type I restriction enzyme HsdR N-terminal domain-containing protein [Prevotellaceae bacterium]|nr:type I restriction enzyme HsdR N-terminal domain-containing protein [Prevotellaceae bacterium]